MEHLSLEVFDREGTDSKLAFLPEDASINITDTSEIFASGDVWSHSFTLNVHANAHIFGSSGDIHGSRLHEQINKRRARLWVEGLPLYLGYLKLDDEVEVDKDGNVDVSFESGRKTFDEMIDGAKANQVPLMGDVEIGMALWRKRWISFKAKMMVSATIGDNLLTGVMNDGEWLDIECDGEEDGQSMQQYPHMMFPKGTFVNLQDVTNETVDCVNADSAYEEDANGNPTNPYCNVALCYQRYGYDRKMEDGSVVPDYSAEPEAQRGYEYMSANRVNSAPNFYVIYWLRCLMNHLGIHIDENQMMGMEDLKRLFFVNTKCSYEEPQKLRTVGIDSRYGKYKATGKLVPEHFTRRDYQPLPNQPILRIPEPNVNIDESLFVGKNITYQGPLSGEVKNVAVRIIGFDTWSPNIYIASNRYCHKAYAKSDCFPNVDIKEVVSAIESGFGVRFLFDGSYNRVRIVLLRNIFRRNEEQEIECEIISDVKVENSIRGFRMTYGRSEDDTNYYYKGFSDKMPHKKPYFSDNSDTHDYSQWDVNAVYTELINKISAFDKTCYVTPDTGNAYGIKIDKDAKRYDELHPSLFEFAGFMDAEDGDCTGDEETIETVNVGFTPAIMNDLNMEAERDGSPTQRFALFVDETMRPRRPDLKTGDDYNDASVVYDVEGGLYAIDDGGFVYEGMMSDGNVKPGEFIIRSDMAVSGNGYAKLRYGAAITDLGIVSFNFEGHVNEGYRLYMQDNYEPNDDGVCPIEKHDWGLTLGIMRGSGSDARVVYEQDVTENENPVNDTWRLVAGSNTTSHPDTCDCYGNRWDYNGTGTGIGNAGGRISLKLRAEKLNPDFDASLPESSTNKRYLEIANPHLRQRGLCDTFYKEYSYWVRNARICKRTVKMEMAQLLAIDKTKRVRVGDVTGFVRKMQYSISKQTGLGLVTMEIMYI